MQTLDIHTCEQGLTAQGHLEGRITSGAVSWTCFLLLPSASAPFFYQECSVDPLFQRFSLTSVLAPFHAISLTLFHCFAPFLLSFLIQKQFHIFDHPCCPFLKLFQHLYTFLRKINQNYMHNRTEKSWTYEVAWWWCPVFSFFLSCQVINTCFSLDCILITSMNSFHGTICHSPELLLLREAVNPSSYIWKQDWFSPTFIFVYIKFHLSFYCPLNLAGSFCKSA